MILRAVDSDKKQVYDIWKEAFYFDDDGYTDFYFSKHYNSKNTFVNKIDGEVVSTLIKTPHTILLHGRFIQASMIIGVATKQKYQRQGHFKELMDVVLDECDHQELITLIQAYDPEIYKPFGFEMVYYRNKFKIRKSDLPKVKEAGITYQVVFKDFLKVYTEFVSKFNGFMVRDEKYYKLLCEEVAACGGKIIACYDTLGVIKGYAVVYQNDNQVEVNEIVYLDSRTLYELLSHILKVHDSLILYTSEAEELQRLFVSAEKEVVGATMVRINDYKLFNRFYHSEVRDVKRAMNLQGKPLFINEIK